MGDWKILVLAAAWQSQFWPLSRPTRPAHLAPLFESSSLLKLLVDTLTDSLGEDRIFVLINHEARPLFERELPGFPESRLVVEPIGRGDGAALAWAAARLAPLAPGSQFVVVPADILIEDISRLTAMIRDSVRIARKTECPVRIGWTCPDNYRGPVLNIGEKIYQQGEFRVYEVKNTSAGKDSGGLMGSRNAARSVLADSGLAVLKVEELVQTLGRVAPELEVLATEMERYAHDSLEFDPEAAGLLPDIAWRDTILAEMGSALLLRGDPVLGFLLGWDDLALMLPADANNNRIAGQVHSLECRDSVIISGEKGIIIGSGLDNLLIVQNKDAVLVFDKRDPLAGERLRSFWKQNPQLSMSDDTTTEQSREEEAPGKRSRQAQDDEKEHQ